jgi:hypothetical protein
LHFSGAHSAMSEDGVNMNTVFPSRFSVVFLKVTSEVVVVLVTVVVVVVVLDVLDVLD